MRTREVQPVCFGESGICNKPSVRRSWSPRGKPHSPDASAGRKQVNVLGALTCAARTLAFAEHGRTVVVADSASIHRHMGPKVLEERMVHDRFVLLSLPPHSPGLDPIEILCRQAKHHCA